MIAPARREIKEHGDLMSGERAHVCAAPYKIGTIGEKSSPRVTVTVARNVVKHA